MANTLILAFAGSALNMLILFRAYDYPLLQVLNSDLMAIEILQGVAGSIGIILTVPLVAALSANILKVFGGADPQQSLIHIAVIQAKLPRSLL